MVLDVVVEVVLDVVVVAGEAVVVVVDGDTVSVVGVDLGERLGGPRLLIHPLVVVRLVHLRDVVLDEGQDGGGRGDARDDAPHISARRELICERTRRTSFDALLQGFADVCFRA